MTLSDLEKKLTVHVQGGGNLYHLVVWDDVYRKLADEIGDGDEFSHPLYRWFDGFLLTHGLAGDISIIHRGSLTELIFEFE